MGYPTRYDRKPEELTPEEYDVVAVLHEYRTIMDEEDAELTDFVPFLTLYEKYLDYKHSTHLLSVDDPISPTLTKLQFGSALRRVWPGIGEYKVKRTINGKRVIGFVGVKGPDSYVVNDGPGKPFSC